MTGTFFDTKPEQKLSPPEWPVTVKHGVRHHLPEQMGSDPVFTALHSQRSLPERSRREPDAYNPSINDSAAAGQTVACRHIRLVPRYRNNVDELRGGVRGVVPEKADCWSAEG